MKLFNKKLAKRLIATSLVALFAFALVAIPKVQAIPYTGENTPPSPVPAFNVYTGNVPDVGNESDFFRVRVDGDSAEPVTDLSSSCETGKKFQYRVYVHNGASQYANGNGNGPSVAKDTKVKVALPGNEASSFTSTATISASNAATVNDNSTIRCTDGRVVKLSYVAGSAQQYSPSSGVKPVSDSIVTTGAPVGTQGPDGNMWGCWDQRVWVRLVVEVKEAPPKPKPSTGVCKVVDVKVSDKRRVEATVTGQVKNAEIIGYEINFGDGTVVNEQTAEHTYKKDGTYRIVGKVRVKYADGKIEWKTANDCMKEVTFKPGEKPQPPKPVTPEPTTPETLPDTGVGDVVGLFAATSAAGAAAHNVYNRRRYGKR